MARSKKSANKSIASATTTIQPKRTRRTKRQIISDAFAAFGLHPVVE